MRSTLSEWVGYIPIRNPSGLDSEGSGGIPLRVLVLAIWPSHCGGAHLTDAIITNVYRNRILASLPAATIKQLAPHLTPVNLPRDLTLREPGRPGNHVYFLEDGICSIVVDLENGMTVEVGIIGRDGFVGISTALGAGQPPNRCFMQVPGYGYRVKTKILVELSEALPPLRLRLLQSVQGLFTQTAQTAACNRVHELHQRLARWLLMCHDRLQTEQIQITQEFLANMLGTRRSSVSVAAGMFQKAGIITYVRGRVNILNRDGLADAACECYKTVHDESVRLGLL